jgi:hypothetical protein
MNFKALLPALAFVAASAAAQSQPPAAPSFSPDAFRAHVAFLADDMLEGRETGTRGYDIAARYVASQFEALGLQPAADGQWFQPVRLVRFAISGTPRLAVGGQAYAHGRDFVLRASPDRSPLSVEAPLVFAGYGLDLPARGYDDYAGLDVRGKVVVVLNGHPAGTPSDVASHLNSEKARMAAERGALGMLVIRTNREEESRPWARLVRYANRPGTTWVDSDGRPYSSSGLGFTATVDRTVASTLFSGAPRTLDAVLGEAARAGARPRGYALAQTVRFERAGAAVTPLASPNVVALLPGTDPALADEHVLLMAHLDGVGVRPPVAGEEAGEDRIRNGAMDNASGVATLIEVARAMSQPGNRPRRPVLFAAVTAEEVGLLGAAYLAANPLDGGRVVSVVNLDMPVLTYDFQDVTAFGAEHSTLGPIVARAAARMNVRVAPDPLPEEGLFTRSDHYPFVRRGVPSVFLMTGFAGEGRQRFTSFLEDHYHGPSDDLSLPFNWNAGARFAQLNFLIAREIANEAQAPLWYADSFFGAAVGSGQRLAERPRAAGGADPAQSQAAPRR